MEALFTVPYTASVVENLQLKAIRVDDRMINIQVGWHGNKIMGEESPATCICNLGNMEIADNSVFPQILVNDQIFKKVMCSF